MRFQRIHAVRLPQAKVSGKAVVIGFAGAGVLTGWAVMAKTPVVSGELLRRNDVTYALSVADQAPDGSSQAKQDNPTQKQNSTADNADRRTQIAEDSAKLHQLAVELKAEVDKTTKDTLSLGVIRKANEIEKLAHSVKDEMKSAKGRK